MATEAQKREELRQNKLNYSVIAGAGAGKTTMLADRISNQIMAGEPIEAFAIITYTNVAAEELREKIIGVLGEAQKSPTITALEKENAKSALERIEMLQISTIHSFLFRILRENCFEAKLAMDAKMLEQFQEDERKVAFYREWRNKNYKDINKLKPGWDYIVKSTGKKDNRAEYILEELFMNIASVREEIYLDYDVDNGVHYSRLLSEARDICNRSYNGLIVFGAEVRNNVPKNQKTHEPVWYAPAKGIIQDINELELYMSGKTLKDLDDEALMALAIKVTSIYKSIEENKAKDFYGKRYADNNNKILTLIPQIYTDKDLQYAEQCQAFNELKRVNQLVRYAKTMREAYQSMTDSETNVISNDDILYRAKKLLENNENILDELREKYTKIYLDEAQDTTNTQLDIIKLLASKPGTKPGDFTPKKDGLIIVGDPKQSIYRFSGAEKLVYDGVNKTIEDMDDADARQVILDENFRSNERIVQWVNNRYSDMIKDCGHNPMTTAWKVSNDDTLSGVYYYPDQAPDKPLPDCERVADLIKELSYNPNYVIEEYDRKNNTYNKRQINYSDFLIIHQWTTNIDAYVDALRSKGITVNVYGKFFMSKDRVLRDFVALTRCIANSKSYRNHVEATGIIAGVDVTGMKSSLVQEVWSKVSEEYNILKLVDMKSSAIVASLLKHTEMYLEKNRHYSPEEVNNYRTRLYQMVESCISGQDEGLNSLVAKMEKYLTTELGRELILTPGKDAVRLMNSHKSKGLTGKIVIMADRSVSKEGRSLSAFRSQGVYYPAAEHKIKIDNVSNTLYSMPAFKLDENIYKMALQAEKDEALRLEYVAATRAAHALIIMPTKGGSNPAGAWFGGDIGDRNILEWMKEQKDKSSTAATAISASHNDANYDEAGSDELNIATLEANLETVLAKDSDECSILDKLVKPTLYSITPSGLEAKGATGYKPDDPDYKAETRPRGNIFGNVTHRTFELIVKAYKRLKSMSEDDSKKAIMSIIKRAILENQEDFRERDNQKEFMNYLYPIALKYFGTVLTTIMADDNGECPEAYPEYSFGFYIHESKLSEFKEKFGKSLEKAKLEIMDDGRVWINGQIDLLVKSRDGKVRIYDYKSDGMYGKPLDKFEESMATKYEGQLKLYVYAASRILGVDEKDITTELIHLYK
ncbi:MAG: UvrD-helicase domain-containing protein [Lachnospiraceae bacterium]|nr:UvrD-helicase domain-containing protein [Lachnospiraceae bacterium]